MKKGKIALMGIALSFLFYACSGGSTTDAHAGAQEKTEQSNAAAAAKRQANQAPTLADVEKRLSKRSIALSAEQKEQVEKIIQGLDFGSGKAKEKRKTLVDKIVDEVLTEEQRAKLDS